MGNRWERSSSITGKIQTLLLFLAFIFCLLPSLGPPLVKIFSLQEFSASYVDNGVQRDVISIGPFGYCSSRNGCKGPSLGYDLEGLLNNATSSTSTIVKIGTTIFIIIPISAGIALIGFIISASGHHIGSAITGAICGIIVNATTALAIGLVNGCIYAAANSFDKTRDATTKMGHGRWMITLACALSAGCWILGLIECCLARQHQKHVRDVEYVPVGAVTNSNQAWNIGSREGASLMANPAPIGVGKYSDPYVYQPIQAGKRS